MQPIQTVLVTGGAGYVGAVLVPRLIRASYRVKVLDLFLYGDGVLEEHPNLEQIHGDVRDQDLLKRILPGCDAVIHLACISNDPGYDLNPELGKAINYDAFGPLVDIAKDSGVKRFIYASSSSVYGIKHEEHVTENLKLEPLTDYSKYKALCEDVLMAKRAPGFTTLILRPATISGYSPRFRCDVVVNIQTMEALVEHRIKVFGGEQYRANLHIADMVECYRQALLWPDEVIDGQVFNVGHENFQVADLARRIKDVLENIRFLQSPIQIETIPTNDLRSYSLCSDKIKEMLGFMPWRRLKESIWDLRDAYHVGKIVDPINNERYYNVRWLKKVGLK